VRRFKSRVQVLIIKVLVLWWVVQVVLVGHSLGGLSCLQFLEAFPHKIGLVIFLAAVVTPSGSSMTDSGPLTDLVQIIPPHHMTFLTSLIFHQC
jgi:pimeloyl-ACP methyl ester carboxylesterase